MDWNKSKNPLIMCLMVLVLATAVPGFARDETRNHQQQLSKSFAHDMLKSERYSEAVSYLNDALSKMDPSPARFDLTLMLAEAHLYMSDADAAGDAIQESFRWARTEKDSSKVWRLKGWQRAIREDAPAYEETDEPAAGAAVDADLSMEDDQPRITNSFFESDLRVVLSDLSMEAGVPILYGGGLEGLVTYDAIDQPLEEVLESILLPLGYAFRERGGKYFVGSISTQDPAFALLSETRIVPLANILANEAVLTVSEFFNPYVKASRSGNAVVITAPSMILERIESDLKEMDKAPVQISIDVIVAEISHEGSLQLGIDWSAANRSEESARQFSAGSPGIDNPAFEFTMTDLGADIAGNILDINATLQTLLQSGDAQIRANPRITAMNGHPAGIKLVREEWFQAQTSGAQSFAYNTLQSISSGIQLNITPFVAEGDDTITMYVFPQVGDVVGQDSDGLPRINTRSAETTVRVVDGETFTIGGLSLEIEESEERKIPLLGSIPFLGYLFRYTAESVRESEVVIFVTPHIV